MKKGFTKHDPAILRAIAKSCIPNQSMKVIQLKGEKLGGVSANLDRIAAALEEVAEAMAAPVDPTAGLAKIFDVFFNGRPA